jgi:hypothetical protein
MKMNTRPIRIVLAAALALLLGATSGCGKVPSLSSVTGSGEAGRQKEPAGLRSISPTPPKPGRPITPIRPFANLEMVAGQGDCAPSYTNGSKGQCINSRPCRGYGMRGPTGAVECRCWAKADGCGEHERCDIVVKRCVPDDKSDFGRGDAD